MSYLPQNTFDACLKAVMGKQASRPSVQYDRAVIVLDSLFSAETRVLACSGMTQLSRSSGTTVENMQLFAMTALAPRLHYGKA